MAQRPIGRLAIGREGAVKNAVAFDGVFQCSYLFVRAFCDESEAIEVGKYDRGRGDRSSCRRRHVPLGEYCRTEKTFGIGNEPWIGLDDRHEGAVPGHALADQAPSRELPDVIGSLFGSRWSVLIDTEIVSAVARITGADHVLVEVAADRDLAALDQRFMITSVHTDAPGLVLPERLGPVIQTIGKSTRRFELYAS